MKKLYCDFCGNEIDIHGNGMKGIKIIFVENEGYANANTEHYDACPKCGQGVRENCRVSKTNMANRIAL